VVLTIGGGKFSFWPEKLPGLTTLTGYPPGTANPIIWDINWRTIATYWWIFYGALGIKKFYFYFIFYSWGEIQFQIYYVITLLYGLNSHKLDTTALKISEYALFNLN
jgi:hypothetical protein